MSQPVVVYWAPTLGNEAIIASIQTLAVAGNLVLNSNQPNSPVSTNGPYIYDKVIRTIAITSGTATTFTITGIGTAVDANGNPTGPFVATTEMRVHGGGGATVYSANIWKEIDSISAPIAVVNVSVGFGSSGITEYVFMDYNKIAWYASCQVQVRNRATLVYTVYESLTKPETVNTLYGNLTVAPQPIPAFAVNVGMTAATTNQIAQLPFPIVMTWATISLNTTAAEDLYFTVLQQGIRS